MAYPVKGSERTGRTVNQQHSVVRAISRLSKRLGVFAAAAALSAGAVSVRADDLLFDWRLTTGAPPVAGYAPAPFVSNANAGTAGLNAQIAANKAAYPGRVAVKVIEPLANIPSVFNATNGINFGFYDLEGPSAAQFPSQAAAVKAASPTTYVGNFRMFPGSGDTSGPTAGPTFQDYLASGANMANEDLYPGSPYYKNPAAIPGGTSTSPNIRSTLFTLPIKRATFVTANLPTGNVHIPYVNRFNNWGNTALDTDGNAANGYQFVQTAADPTTGQLISRGDFKAMVAHYRLRGVNGVHLLDGGVQGYTQAQFEQDAKDGFKLPQIDAIFNGAGARLASLDTVGRVDGVVKDIEQSGVVVSGVYSLTQNKLALLVSNLDGLSHNIDLQQKIGGKTIPGSYAVAAGQHRLLEFTGAGTQWSLLASTPLFTSAAETDRTGVGVPEPMALGTLSIFAAGLLLRRRRK